MNSDNRVYPYDMWQPEIADVPDKGKWGMQLLQEALQGQGFHKRGKAFFRVHGDGIVQVLKFEYERMWHELRVGFLSMYGEIEEQWLTSSGCIPHYEIVRLVGRPNSFPIVTVHGPDYVPKSWMLGQIEVLKDFGIARLNEMQTQQDMLDEIFFFQTSCGGIELWNDPEKFAPFLKMGNFADAARVARAILRLRMEAYNRHSDRKIYFNLDGTSEDVLPPISMLEDEIDIEWLQKLELALEADPQKVNDYLQANYERNLKLTKFRSKSVNK